MSDVKETVLAPAPACSGTWSDYQGRWLARRGEAWGTSESRQMIEHAIETGRGGVFLRLTARAVREADAA